MGPGVSPVALNPLAAHTPPCTFFQGPSGMRSGTAGIWKDSAAVDTSARTRSLAWFPLQRKQDGTAL